RTLFHAAIDRAVDKSGGSFTEDRWLFNATVMHEIRAVLDGEHRLPPSADEHILFREFAALFLELRYFAREQVADYFPGFLHPEEVARFLEQRFAANALFQSTRPEGALEPAQLRQSDAHSVPIASAPASVADATNWTARARQASAQGNDVRAAILYRRADE